MVRFSKVFKGIKRLVNRNRWFMSKKRLQEKEESMDALLNFYCLPD